MKRQFTGVFIPASIYLDKQLTASQKLKALPKLFTSEGARNRLASIKSANKKLAKKAEVVAE